MRLHLSFLVVILLAAGCASPRSTGPSDANPRLSNTAEYDAYVARRSAELGSTGKYSELDALQLAESEATRRYGPKTSSTLYPRQRATKPQASRALTAEELAKATASAKP